MNRWLLIGSLAAMLVGTTGCLHHNVRSNCGSCGTCNTGSCNTGACGSGCNDGCNTHNGMLGQLGGLCGVCGHHGCRNGCVAGPLGWQQGGHNYSSHLQSPHCLGHGAGHALENQPFVAGPPTAQTAYPYYTVRGPRDFLVDNPPSIGR